MTERTRIELSLLGTALGAFFVGNLLLHSLAPRKATIDPSKQIATLRSAPTDQETDPLREATR
jgi:hypothetical protein